MIKFFDIYRQVRKFFKKNINDLIKIIKHSRFINGQSVKLFESKFFSKKDLYKIFVLFGIVVLFIY